MEKEQKLKKLTWKYFWEQKWEEIKIFLLITFILISVVGLCIQGGWACKSNKGTCNIPYEPSVPIWMLISGIITTVIWIIIGIIYWIKSNWEYADERAREKLHLKIKERSTKCYY